MICLQQISKFSLDFGFVSVFKRLVEKHIENLAEDLLLYPKLKTQSFLKKQTSGSKEIEKFTVYPASAVFISSKSNNINGVVNELELLKKSTNFSTGIQQFLTDSDS